MKTIKTKNIHAALNSNTNVGGNVGTNSFVPSSQPALVGATNSHNPTKKVRINSYPQNQTSQPRANKFAPTALMLALTAAGFFALPPQSAHAAPQGGQVIAGQATISQPNANTTTITQSTQKAIIDWQSFSIAANQHTQFIQPSAASVTLNRVVGGDPSQILGRLTANGQVFLVNPNGIYFGKNAQVDVAGLIATTHNIRNEDFLAGNYTFNIAGKAGAAVINDGMIHIADTGIAAFVAPSVANRGVIVARLGKIMLASANGFTLDFSGDQLISFLVNDQVAQTAFDLQGKPLTSFVENAGQIQAQGGYVLLTAKAAENAIHSVINQTGSIEATTVGTHNGTIILNAGTGSLNVAGTLDASALPSPTGRGAASLPPLQGEGRGGDGVNGGFIETSGAHVKIDPTAKITTAAPFGKAGTWLIDPVDFIIAATGGDITGAQLAARLANSNIEIQTLPTGTGNGDIFVNDAVTWNTLNKLTLTAYRDIDVSANINALGGGSVKLRADATGTGTGTVYLARGNGHITANGGTVGIFYNPVGGYTGADKSDTTGNTVTPYVTLSGGSTLNVYMLVNDVNQLQAMNTNLGGIYALGKNIDASATATWNAGAGFVPVGTFIGVLPTSSANASAGISLVNSFTGTFDGQGNTIQNLFINRPTTDNVGLFGFAGMGSVIKNIGLIGGSVSGNQRTGELVGCNDNGTISNAYATGNVNGNWDAGVLVGLNNGGNSIVSNSYATGSVIGIHQVGGLVGSNNFGTIINSYATGSVSGTGIGGAGGLVAGIGYGGVGGLTGYNYGLVNYSYSTGLVTGATNPGGLVGRNFTTVTNSYWDTQTSGQPTSSGGTGLTTAQMQQQANFTGWDFVNTWQIAPNAYPTLKAFTLQPTANTVVNPTTNPVAGVDTCAIGWTCVSVPLPPAKSESIIKGIEFNAGNTVGSNSEPCVTGQGCVFGGVVSGEASSKTLTQEEFNNQMRSTLKEFITDQKIGAEISEAYAILMNALVNSGFSTKMGIAQWIAGKGDISKQVANKLFGEIANGVSLQSLGKDALQGMVYKIVKDTLLSMLGIDKGASLSQAGANYVIEQALIVTKVVLSGGSIPVALLEETQLTVGYITDLYGVSQDITQQNNANISSLASLLSSTSRLLSKAADLPPDSNKKNDLIAIAFNSIKFVNSEALPQIKFGFVSQVAGSVGLNWFASGKELSSVTTKLVLAKTSLLQGKSVDAGNYVKSVIQQGRTLSGGNDKGVYIEAVRQLISDMGLSSVATQIDRPIP